MTSRYRATRALVRIVVAAAVLAGFAVLSYRLCAFIQTPCAAAVLEGSLR